jgi:hypothetical protein
MDKKSANNLKKGHYDVHKKSQYFYRSVKLGTQGLQAIEEKSGSDTSKPFSSLVHDKSSNLIIATAMLLSKSSQEIVVTVKKRTDIAWTNVYSIEHNVKNNVDYATSFSLEAYLKEKIKRFENSLYQSV